MTLVRICLLGGAVCTLPGCAGATSTLKGAGYYDTRGLPTGTVSGTVTHVPWGTRLFAFSDVETDSAFPKYLEAALSQRIVGRLAGLVEYNRDFNAPTGTHRFGVTYQLPLPSVLRGDRFSVKYTPYSTNGRGAQLSLAGSKRLGPNASIDGFFDYNVKPDRIVTDWQIGRRLTGNVYAVVEYRYSGLRADSTGLGIGLEWRVW